MKKRRRFAPEFKVQVVDTWKTSPGGPLLLSFNLDGSRIASEGADGSVQVWSVADGRLLAPVQGPSRGSVRAIAFTRDGLRVVSDGEPGSGPEAASPPTASLTVWDAKVESLTNTP